MNLARGAGAEGLAGMPVTRPTPGGRTVIRPLLETARSEIEAFLAERDQPYVTDATNSSGDYTRNFVRLELIPRLEQINPRFLEHASAAAASLRADSALLDELAAPLAQRASVSELAAAPEPLALRALRLLCAPCVPSRVQTEALLRLCRAPDPSGEVTLSGGLVARRRYDALEIGPVPPPDPLPSTPLAEGETKLPGLTVCLRREPAPIHPGRELWLRGDCPLPLLLRSRREGDAITLAGRPRKTLKKLFIDEKVPAAGRDRVPVLEAAGAVAAVGGFGTDAAFLPAPGELSWHITLLPSTERT